MEETGVNSHDKIGTIHSERCTWTYECIHVQPMIDYIIDYVTSCNGSTQVNECLFIDSEIGFIGWHKDARLMSDGSCNEISSELIFETG